MTNSFPTRRSTELPETATSPKSPNRAAPATRQSKSKPKPPTAPRPAGRPARNSATTSSPNSSTSTATKPFSRPREKVPERPRAPSTQPFSRLREKVPKGRMRARSEEHTSELQSLMRISYAVFCLKKKKQEEQKDIPNIKHTAITQKGNEQTYEYNI